MTKTFNPVALAIVLFFAQYCQSQTISFSYDSNKNMITKTKTGISDHIVQNGNDSGAGSLREIVSDACPEDTVNFSTALIGDTITLTGPEIKIDKNLYILGLDQDSLTISGENNSRIFNVQPNLFVGIEKVKLIKGKSPTEGGALLNRSQNLVLKNVTFEKNKEGSTNKALTNLGHIKIENIVIIKP